jgi:hypothetical protein
MNTKVYSYMLKLVSMSFSKVTLDILDVQKCFADCRMKVSAVSYLFPLLSYVVFDFMYVWFLICVYMVKIGGFYTDRCTCCSNVVMVS